MNMNLTLSAGRAALVALALTVAGAPAQAASTYTYNFSSGDTITLGPLHGQTRTTRVCLLDKGVKAALTKLGYKDLGTIKGLLGKKVRSVQVEATRGHARYRVTFNRCTGKVETRKRIGTV